MIILIVNELRQRLAKTLFDLAMKIQPELYYLFDDLDDFYRIYERSLLPIGAKKIRQEGEASAQRITKESDTKAEAILSTAKQQSDRLLEQ